MGEPPTLLVFNSEMEASDLIYKHPYIPLFVHDACLSTHLIRKSGRHVQQNVSRDRASKLEAAVCTMQAAQAGLTARF